MIYHLRHRTTFEYSQPVTFVYNLLHLKPRSMPWQTVRTSRLTVLPEPAVLTELTDYFGNTVTYCTVQERHAVMQVLIESEIEVSPRPPNPSGGTPWDQAAKKLKADASVQGFDAFQFCFNSPVVERMEAARSYAMPSCKPGLTMHQVAIDLMHRINEEFTFDPTATSVATPVREVLEKKRGVCQDFAHLMICCLRSVGIPARYNSGYIQTTPPPGKPRLQGADASHAWVGVYCPQNGWLDLDPTNDKPADEQFITIGWGRDYQDVSPVTGVLIGGGEHKVRAEVDMVPDSEFSQSQQQQQQ
jgi:transglutaminase-like putative cysteine protease